MHASDEDETLEAGEFGAWLAEIRGAIRGENDAQVPCGSCVGCCSSSQFVHIGPDETDALAHIPPQLLFPAPRAPRGHVLMGYDRHGRCPMLRTDGCSIYEHRPTTCRTYDCRVFAAAGLDPVVAADAADTGIGATDDLSKVLVADRVRRWRFEHRDDDAVARHAAVGAAAAWLRAHGNDLPDELAPLTTTQTAVAAVLAADAFVTTARRASVSVEEPSVESVRVEITRRRLPANRRSSR